MTANWQKKGPLHDHLDLKIEPNLACVSLTIRYFICWISQNQTVIFQAKIIPLGQSDDENEIEILPISDAIPAARGKHFFNHPSFGSQRELDAKGDQMGFLVLRDFSTIFLASTSFSFSHPTQKNGSPLAGGHPHDADLVFGKTPTPMDET